MLCYNIEQYQTSLHVVIQMKANKFILLVIAVFLIQILRGLTLIFLTPSVFIPKRFWNLSRPQCPSLSPHFLLAI